MNKKPKTIDFDKDVILPIIKNQNDITFGALQYVDNVVGALLQAKRVDGPAWKSASKLVDVTVDTEGHVHLELKVHCIDVGHSGGPVAKPDIVKFEY
jgi:hypothetical protein